MFLFGGIGYSIVETVKVTGPIYQSIALTQRFDSYIMPLDLYLIEAQLNLYVLLDENDSTKFSGCVDQLRESEKAFQDAHDKFNKLLPDGQSKNLLNGVLYTEGQEWIRIVDSEIVAAKLHHDQKSLRAAIPAARVHFAAHKKAVYELDKILQEDVAHQETEAKATIRTRMVILLAVGLAGLALILFFGMFTSRLITTSLNQAVTVLQSAATGDLCSRVEIDSKDEAGIMGHALNDTLDRIADTVRSIQESAVQLANASEEFSAVSLQIGANSEETSAQANTVSSATEEVNRGLQTVASATEEMSTSIKEIAKNTTEAANVTDGAMRTASEANAVMTKLGASSQEVGKVIKVITSIAQKTDLLALNATVEAARAGEIGAGFAVVANEVKELAKQTSTATEDISRKVEAIQADAKSAVTAISRIIGQVNDISGTIATAVEEQSATTSEMSRSISEAAKESAEVAQNIQSVAQAAKSTSQGATESQKAAKNVAEMSTHLRELVGRFKLEQSRRSVSRGKTGRSSSSVVNRDSSEELEEQFVTR